MKNFSYVFSVVLLISCGLVKTTQASEREEMPSGGLSTAVVKDIAVADGSASYLDDLYDFEEGDTISNISAYREFHVVKIKDVPDQLFNQSKGQPICFAYQNDENYVLLELNEKSHVVLKKCYYQVEGNIYRCGDSDISLKGDTLKIECTFGSRQLHDRYILTKEHFEHLGCVLGDLDY